MVSVADKSREDSIPPAIRVQGLKKTFGEGEASVLAVDNVSFEVKSGSVVGLLGPNGAGKTTMIKSMLGLVIPDRGAVEVAGIDVHENPERAYNRIGAIMEGARNIYWRLTVQENLSFFAGLGGEEPSNVRDRHRRLLELTDLEEKADTPVNELSRGMKQKVSLASTLARDVDVVFMDEPTLGLDVEASVGLRSELRRLADNEDVTIILTSHDMDVIEEVCDRVLILQDGSIITDDDVDALLDLFDIKKYRVTVSEQLKPPLVRELRQSFDVEVQNFNGEARIDATVTDTDTVYDLLTAIKSSGKSLLDIQSVEPDLEEVFLQLVNAGERTMSTTSERRQHDATDRESEKQTKSAEEYS
jgi:ABC-2 type transport system ATP-binding protein